MARARRITEREIEVRQVTHWQPTWTEGKAGEPGTWTIQLILDHGAAEHVLRPAAADAEVLVQLLEDLGNVYFDTSRGVLMFGNREAL